MFSIKQLTRVDWLLAALFLAIVIVGFFHPLAAGVSIAMMGLGRPILTQQDLDAHRTALAQQDIIYAPLYDSASYATAGQNQLVLFTAPLGSGTTTAPSATGTKTLADTNMNAAGQLTKGNEFFMIGQELMFLPGESIEQGVSTSATTALNNFINDTYIVGKSGFLTLQIGSNRNYIQDGPLMIFPPSARLAVAGAAAISATAAATSFLNMEYASWTGEPYAITPVYIEATQGFSETLSWPAVVTINSTARIFSRLRGYLIRNAQ